MPPSSMRTHYCGALRAEHAGEMVRLCGWVHRVRDLGGLLLMDLRDGGEAQEICSEDTQNPSFAKSPAFDVVQLQFASYRGDREILASCQRESVVQVSGTVHPRPAGAENPQLATGMVEVHVHTLTVLSAVKTQTLPFLFDSQVDTKEALRLRYRYLDLRHPAKQQLLKKRSQVCLAIHNYFQEKGFHHIDTPMLYKPTPEGARDFLVPARKPAKHLFALPQSPQTLKQLLMIAGMEKYYQIVKCFRDEDFRADRQPEFTQLDIEQSFVDASDMKALATDFLRHLFQRPDLSLTTITCPAAMELFASDKPDLRYGLPWINLTSAFAGSEFPPFAPLAQKDATHTLYATFVPASCAQISRKNLDTLKAFVGEQSAGAFFSIKVTGHEWGGGGLGKWLHAPTYKAMVQCGLESHTQAQRYMGAGPRACPSVQTSEEGFATGIWLLVLTEKSSAPLRDALRKELFALCALPHNATFSFLWVDAFPLFSWQESDATWTYTHHPFTAPADADAFLASSAPTNALLAQSYDVVCNGYEIGGGSIRIHSEPMQRHMLHLLGLAAGEVEEKFGFFMEALRYGAPPHGGIAFGLDRMVMLLAGVENIRDVIPFPKTTSGQCLMSHSPVPAQGPELEEHGWRPK